jgi:TonB family protein
MTARIALGFLAACALAAALPTAASDATWAGTKWATVDIDDSGRVVAIELEPDLTPAFEAALRHEIASWAFEPARMDGAAVASRTHLAVRLRARELGTGRAGVEVVSVRNGPRPAGRRAMHYPEAALERHIQGTVMLTLTVAPDGSVADVSAQRGAHSLLRRAALRSADGWRFVPEQVAGQPVATRVRAPVAYCITTDPVACRVADRDAAGAPVRHPDETVAIDSPVRLKADPAGRLLGG